MEYKVWSECSRHGATRYENGLDRQASHLYVLPAVAVAFVQQTKKRHGRRGSGWQACRWLQPLIEDMSCCPKLPHLALLLQHPRVQCEQYVLLRQHQNDWKLKLMVLLSIRGTICTPLHTIESPLKRTAQGRQIGHAGKDAPGKWSRCLVKLAGDAARR